MGLLTLSANRHRFLPAYHLRNKCSHNLPHNRNSSRTDTAPNLDTHRAQWRAREGHNPLNVVGEPAFGESKDRGLGVPELQEDFQSVCAEPASGLGAPVEGGFLRGEGLVCEERCVSSLNQPGEKHGLFSSMPGQWDTYSSPRIPPWSCHGVCAVSPISRTGLAS